MKKVLIVEDEKALSQAYDTILSKEGYEVACAYDGYEALTYLADHTPDLILLDLRMPGMGGLDLLRQYDNPDKAAKVIIFSNHDDQKEIDLAYSLGADRYMLKAWASPKELVRIVADALGIKPKKKAA